MSRVVIIGAGPMGLGVAWHAIKAGHAVTVLESDRVPGGMAAHFHFGDLSIERFYHFICKTDDATFDVLKDLGISNRLRWRPTSMGYYINGMLYKWGDPFALLSFPLLGYLDKFRYARHVFSASKRRDWSAIERLNVQEWITAEAGQNVWNLLWRRSFDLKFYELTKGVSATWLGFRIKRLAASRRSIFQEELGYIEGGSEVLVDALCEDISARGGRILCQQAAQKIEVRDNSVTGVRTKTTLFEADHVVSTIPIPYAIPLAPDLPAAHRTRLESIQNIGVVCVIVKIKRSVTPHFWVNINDPRIEVPGIIEFSNLRPVGHTIVYVPFYMPQSNAKFGRDDGEFIAESKNLIKTMNPDIKDDDFLDAAVGRLRYAQPVCGPGFGDLLPPIQTPIQGLQIADTSYYYPEDRGISESLRLAKKMAEDIR